MANIIKPGARRAAEDNGVAFRAKRIRLPKIEIAQQPMMQAQALVQEADVALIAQEQRAEQPMEQEQWAEQPIKQEQWAEQPMVDAALVQAQAPIAPPSAHLPNDNGARKPLVLNGVTIEVDPMTFMVNATQMCKAAGKRWILYYDNDKTKTYIRHIEAKVGIPTFDLIRSKPGHNGGTMVYLLIALDLASWLSPEVKAQFNMWNAELLLTGRVELGNEMSTQQLEDVWKRRIEEGEAKAAVDLDAERNHCREIILQKNELELRLATIQDAQQLTKAAQEELMAIKAREDLETTIQALVNNTAPTIASFKNGDNVLYLARIDETKFKYGHTKNIVQRFDAHMRPGVYPTFEPVGIFSCNNGVASEDKLRGYVKKEKIGCCYTTEYGTQREVITLGTVNEMHRFIKKMQKCTTFLVSNQPANDNTDVVLRRIDAEVEMKRIELLMECKITFEQYLQMK